jgi:CDP-diglyceride synthetase
MTTAIASAVGFVAVGILLIRFRDGIARVKTDLDQSAFPFVPKALMRVTPGGVVLTALILFFLAILAIVGGLVESGAR